MPNYEYQCTDCKHLFEIWQPVGEAPPACPECGSVVKKIFHAPRVIFKGSGFYVTDLRAEQAAKKSGSNSSTATETGEAATKTETSSTPTSGETAKTETKADSTPAATNGSDQKSGGDHK